MFRGQFSEEGDIEQEFLSRRQCMVDADAGIGLRDQRACICARRVAVRPHPILDEAMVMVFACSLLQRLQDLVLRDSHHPCRPSRAIFRELVALAPRYFECLSENIVSGVGADPASREAEYRTTK